MSQYFENKNLKEILEKKRSITAEEMVIALDIKYTQDDRKIIFQKVRNRITIYDCPIIHFPKIENRSGNITPIENFKNVPFEIKRVFYIYDIPGGEDRGAHAHKKCHQMIVAASGSFDIFMDDGMNKKSITLNKPYYGLHIPPGIWAAERCFSSGAICLVLTSEIFDEKDYIRDYSDYKIYISEKI